MTEEVQQLTNTVRGYLKSKNQNIFEIGRIMRLLNGYTDHGNWQIFLKREFNISPRTAERYMNVYRRFKDGLDFPVRASVLYALAKPSTPDSVVYDILQQIKDGDMVKPEDVVKMAEERGAIQVKLTPAERVLKHLRQAEGEVRKTKEFSCIEREDILQKLAQLIDWMEGVD